jgi:ankyrin repeat protein
MFKSVKKFLFIFIFAFKIGADINFTGPKEVTPLMWACKSNKPELVCYLL